jgi:alpha-beta hydrolase superfamily lysophospholipase
LVLAAPAAASDEISGPRDSDSALTAAPPRYFARHGFRVVNADYPLGDLDAANRYVLRLARRLRREYRHVYAYGESAGGGIAAVLSARGAVDAAVANSPVADPATWEGLDWAPRDARRRASAARYVGRRSTPTWFIQAEEDAIVPPSATVRLARRFGKRGRLTMLPGDRHIYMFLDIWGGSRPYCADVVRYFRNPAARYRRPVAP